MTNRIFLTCTLLFLSIPNYCQTDVFNHPRGLIKKSEIQEIRERAGNKPYSEMLGRIESTVVSLKNDLKSEESSAYQEIYLATNLAYLYILKGDNSYAEQAFDVSNSLIQHSEYLKNDVSRGLTRATIIFNLAIIYDLCYEAFSAGQRQLFLDALYVGMLTVNSNMGYSANYSIESNWMGVRYATVLFTALVWDETNPDFNRSRALPFIWDTQKRLADHIEANIHPQGWNAESLGYHGYNWSFIAPAIIALQNHSSNEAFALRNFAPHALGSLHSLATSSVPIETSEGNYGVKPDFSDDNLNTGMFLFSCGQRIYPENQQPPIKWMYDYYVASGIPLGMRGTNFYNIVYDNPATDSKNPEVYAWTNFVDTTQGIVVMRDKFQDKNDIVFAFNTTATRVRGHQGFDNLGIRLIGLDNIWIVGAGRTGEVAGQSTLFPEGNIPEMKGEKGATGNLIAYEFTGSGGYAIGEGSCMHVKNHNRQVYVDFDPHVNSEAIIRIDDSSENGKTWRVNTPEFNQVEILKDGFLITAPNKTTLRAYVMEGPDEPKITTTKVRYGGSTVRHNAGICFHGECYEQTKAVDILCNGNISVVFTLQKAGVKLPITEEIRQWVNEKKRKKP